MKHHTAQSLESLIPLPPKAFMELVCGEKKADLAEHFRFVGKRIVAALRDHALLTNGIQLLDVGCGCGRVARFLVDEPVASYTGFDRHPGMINWCEREISARQATFRFHYFDIKSSYVHQDEIHGRLDAAHFRFPYDDESFDVALVSSVFTHMTLEQSRHYLYELSRTLKPRGKILASVFLTRTQPYAETINFYYTPAQFRDAVISSGLHLTPEQQERLTSGRNLNYDHCQHNWFIIQN